MNWLTKLLFGEPEINDANERQIARQQAYALTYEVGKATAIVTYLDIHGKVAKAEGILLGDVRYSHIKQSAAITYAETNFSKWLKESVEYGFLDFGGRRMIPRERVLEIYVTYLNYECQL